MSDRNEVLTQADFGRRIAEDEVNELHGYFVKTEQWRKLLAGEIDIVFGAKGTGKSALYSLLVAQQEQLRLGRRTLFIAAENPRGAPVFRDMKMLPPLGEEQFRALWKLYFLSISASYLKHHMESHSLANVHADEVFEVLNANGLLAKRSTLVRKLKAVFDYLTKYFPTFEGGVIEPTTGLELKGKISFSQPSDDQKGLGYNSIDDLLELLDNAFKAYNITVWLALDRLDVAFADSPELETNAIKSLFRTYLDMLSLSQIKTKIFLRDDIWKNVVNNGFREASHVTRTTNLSWNRASILNLIVSRIVSNDKICNLYCVDKDSILEDAKLQEQFFYLIFPNQIDSGKKPATLDWILSRTADGTNRTAPREVIHLLLATRDEQLKNNQLGLGDPPNNQLFDRSALRSAVPEVSRARFDQTLCAENASLKPYFDKLEREKTQHTVNSLSAIWKMPVEKTQEVIEKMVAVGFFERRGSKDSHTYWIPFIYRDALSLIQGRADDD